MPLRIDGGAIAAAGSNYAGKTRENQGDPGNVDLLREYRAVTTRERKYVPGALLAGPASCRQAVWSGRTGCRRVRHH